jgi:hypothetical protein
MAPNGSSSSAAVDSTGTHTAPDTPSAGATSQASLEPKTNVRDEGFTVLSEGIKPIAESVAQRRMYYLTELILCCYSIIFIHGIQGHPQQTWTYPAIAPAKAKSNIRSIFHRKHKSTAGGDTEDSLYWPKDLLSKDFENTRVLTYGYDSQVSHFFQGPANQNNISAHGRSLLNALELYRRDNPRQPIIFVVHSLGGIILKEVGCPFCF